MCGAEGGGGGGNERKGGGGKGGRERAIKLRDFTIIYDPSENNSTSVSRPSLVF